MARPTSWLSLAAIFGIACISCGCGTGGKSSDICTGEGEDPFASGDKVQCCDALDMKLHDLDNKGYQSYRCVARPSPEPTTASASSQNQLLQSVRGADVAELIAEVTTDLIEKRVGNVGVDNNRSASTSARRRRSSTTKSARRRRTSARRRRSTSRRRRSPSGHSPRPSTGCGRNPTHVTPGEASTLHLTVGGIRRKYVLHVPKSYDPSSPVPLVMGMHGYCHTALSERDLSGMSIMAEKYGFIAAFPEGMQEGVCHSWNVAGTTQSPGPLGATCSSSSHSQDYCFSSCAPCPKCSWTTCHNDVTPSGVGTSHVTGFLPKLYDHLLEKFCIDEGRLYASGKSNGGMATYQLGVSMAERLAAIVPIAGSFQRGFAQAPTLPVPVMDIHGTGDLTVPSNWTHSNDGFYYTKTADIFKGWRGANKCDGDSLKHWRTMSDGKFHLYCVSEGSGCGAPVVRCAWDGGHNHFGYNGDSSGELVWGFLSQFFRRSDGTVGRIPQRSDETVGRSEPMVVL